MMNYSPGWDPSKTIVVDANIAVRAVIRTASSPAHLARLEKWHDENAAVFAPAFWVAEVVSAIRQYVYQKEITLSEAQDAVDDVFDLRVDIVPLDKELCKNALRWAAKIQQSKIYDSLYLALAEHLHADFWTADKKLAAAARTAGAKWVHWAEDV